MSSNIDAVAEGSIQEENAPPVPTPRRFPPPCWTQEEALALIEAYRERWYALRRGYLRTADWDTVAASVTSRCPDASPAKTSAQCRHKMEKLRQRYRAEKQRSLSCPTGRFFSSWFFFDNMDAMENGTTVSAIRSNHQIPDNNTPNNNNHNNKQGLVDPNLLKLKINPNMNTNFMFNHGVNVAKNPEKIFGHSTAVPPNGSYYSNYMEMGSNGMSLRGKRESFRSYDCDEGSEYNGSNASDGFHHARNMGSARRSYGGVEANVDSRFSPPKTGKKKRGRDPMEEMVLSIRLLGEGFIKMEKMKMEMAKEVEHMRMEMEMKRNEMILESQKQIVGAFVKVLTEVNKNNNNVKSDNHS